MVIFNTAREFAGLNGATFAARAREVPLTALYGEELNATELVAAVVDFEGGDREIRANISVSDGNFTVYASLRVLVLNINDNVPVFDEESVSLVFDSVPEIDSTLAVLSASDY